MNKFTVLLLLILISFLSCTPPENEVYSVVYDGNGATNGSVPTDDNTYESGQSAEILGNMNNLFREGLAFNGWNTEADGSGESYSPGESVMIWEHNIILYAQWVTAVYINYSAGEVDGGEAPVDTSAYAPGTEVMLEENPGEMILYGYYFAGWYEDYYGDQIYHYTGNSVTLGNSSMNLNPIWIMNTEHRVSYEPNGAESGSVPVYYEYWPEESWVNIYGNTGDLKKFGFVFGGWNTQNDGTGSTYLYGDTFQMETENVTLYALWLPAPVCTITYYGNNEDSGTVPVDGNEYYDTSTVTVKENSGGLLKSGYLCTGWNTESDGSGTFHGFGTTFSMGPDSVSLYAVWTPAFTVTYDGNNATGGILPEDSTLYLENETVDVTRRTMDRENYSFTGWNTESDGSGDFYRADERFQISDQNVILYAQWSSEQGFVTVWETSYLRMPLSQNGEYDFQVNWGDGTADTITDSNSRAKYHTYENLGRYTVEITGTVKGWKTIHDSFPELKEISHWGPFSFGPGRVSEHAFDKCISLEITADDVPDLSETTSLAYAFYAYRSADIANISSWNTENITDMSFTFAETRNFTSDLTGWNTENVTTMNSMFYKAWDFNGDISTWDTGKLEDMTDMFWDARKINQDLVNWNTENVTTMYRTFYQAYQFDGDISKWNTGKVTDMFAAFYRANSFNQDISGWNVGNVRTIGYMFCQADCFNSDLKNWNTEKVTDMGHVFEYAASFNGDVSGWKTENVTNMNHLFYAAEPFNQDLSSWDVEKVTDMENMMNLTSMSTENYDKLLISWSAQNVHENIKISVEGYYSPAAQAARDILVNVYHWDIYDRGLEP